MQNGNPTSFPGSSPSLPLERERERETLGNAGHVSPKLWEMIKHNIEGGSGKSGVMVRICQPLPLYPRIWEMTKHNIEGGSGKSGVMVRIFQPLPLCYVLSSPIEKKEITTNQFKTQPY